MFKQLRVVNHFVGSTKLRILVGKRVEAVWALRNDLAHTHAVQHFNVWHGQHLEQVLIAASARAVTSAHFTWSKNCHVNAGTLEQLRHRLRNFFILVVEASCATNPVQVLVIESSTWVKYGDVQVFCPFATIALAHPPWVALVFHCAVGVTKFCREVAFHE